MFSAARDQTLKQDWCYKERTDLSSGLMAYISTHKLPHLILRRRHLFRYRLTAAIQRTKGQLWLISYFRQLLTTKVTTAHWTCISSTPTHEWPSSLEMLKEHTILNYTQYSPTKMCGMKNMWTTSEKTLYVKMYTFETWKQSLYILCLPHLSRC